jgi:hypothetical protein
VNILLLLTDKSRGTATLTTDSPQSHYGLPILRIESEGDFGPADMVDHIVTAADIVAGWASNPGRTAEEIGAARMFLRQWPDGPQIMKVHA